MTVKLREMVKETTQRARLDRANTARRQKRAAGKATKQSVAPTTRPDEAILRLRAELDRLMAENAKLHAEVDRLKVIEVKHEQNMDFINARINTWVFFTTEE